MEQWAHVSSSRGIDFFLDPRYGSAVVEVHSGRAAPSSHDDAYDVAAEQKRALTIVKIGLPLVLLVTLAEVALGIIDREPLRLLGAAMPGVALVALYWGKRRIEAGRVRQTVRFWGYLIILAAAMDAIILPGRFMGYEMIIMTSMMLVLPHVHGQSLRRFLWFSLPIAILVPILCIWFPLTNIGSALENQVLTTVILVSGVVLSVILMVQFAARLRGTITRLVGSNRALEAAERVLQARTRKLRATLDTRRDAVVTFNAEDHVTYINPAGKTLFGIDPDNLGDADLDDFVHFEFPNEHASFSSIVSTARGEERAVALPEGTFVVLPDAQRIPVEGMFTPLPDGAVLAVEDIGEKQRAEAVRIAKERAEAATRARSEFLANVSHEIRTPMNAVIGMSAMLEATTLDDEQREFVGTIQTSGAHLLTLINDVLDFSKIDAGAMLFEQYEFDVGRCVDEAFELTSATAVKKGLELFVEIQREVPTKVIADAGRLRQILVNLLSNAIKFTEKGEIIVSVDATLRDGGQVELQFAVKDTGIGIPPEKLDRLFKAFGQADASTARRYGGTGLGLVISKQLAERMGGGMSVASVAGAGSTFAFSIVVPVGTSPATPSSQWRNGKLAGKRVLIVDDNATARRILHGYCSGWGMIPTALESPADALTSYRNERFDFVLLDHEMPGMKGVELAREMASSNQGTPILLMCALGMTLDENDKRLIATRVMKPLRETQLLEQLMAISGGHGRPIAGRTSGQIAKVTSKRLRTLLVEDNQINQRIAILFLKKLGIVPDLAADGEEALVAVERKQYDVVLMDVQMPTMDGLEATRRICSQYPIEHRPYIIGMTANALDSDRDECLHAGMDDYLQKPVEMEAFAAALQRGESRRLERVKSKENG